MREPRSLYFDHASVLLSKDVLLFAASRFEIMQVKLKRESYTKASQNVYDEWQLHRHRMARQYAKPVLPNMIETPQVRMRALYSNPILSNLSLFGLDFHVHASFSLLVFPSFVSGPDAKTQ